MTRFFLLLLFIAFSLTSIAQSPVISNQKTFGGSNSDILTSSILLNNKEIIAAGYSSSSITGDKTTVGYGLSDYWITKFDSNLNIIWQKSFGGDQGDYLFEVIQTKDNNILCVGSSTSDISGNKTSPQKGPVHFWIIKLDLNGNELWQKSLGGSGPESYPSVVEDAFGNLLFVGNSSSDISFDKTDTTRGGTDFWLIKTDSLGNKLWDKTYGGTDVDMYPQITLNSIGELL